MKMENLHLKYLNEAMNLAEKGRAFVSPNPMVGAVLVRNGKIIAKDWHRKFGEGHAERNLLEKFGPPLSSLNVRTSPPYKGEILSSDVLYITLEPCCFQGKTPACTDIILEKGVKNIVVGLFDPNPEVAGKGVRHLRKNGVEVLVLEELLSKSTKSQIRNSKSKIQSKFKIQNSKLLLLIEQLLWQNRFFFRWVKDRRPWVTLKIAQTLDGRVVPNRGKQYWLTGEESKYHVHEMRALYDAILVGAKTVIVDNPSLTVRISKTPKSKYQNPNKFQKSKSKIQKKNELNKIMPISSKNLEFGNWNLELPQPQAVVLDAALSIPMKSQVIRPGTIIFMGKQYKKRLRKKKNIIDEGVEVVEVDVNADGYLVLHQVLDELAARGIASLYVEGGPAVWSSFLREALVDELMIYWAPKFMGKGVSSFEGLGLKEGKEVKFRGMEVLGDDVYWQGVIS